LISWQERFVLECVGERDEIKKKRRALVRPPAFRQIL